MEHMLSKSTYTGKEINEIFHIADIQLTDGFIGRKNYTIRKIVNLLIHTSAKNNIIQNIEDKINASFPNVFEHRTKKSNIPNKLFLEDLVAALGIEDYKRLETLYQQEIMIKKKDIAKKTKTFYLSQHTRNTINPESLNRKDGLDEKEISEPTLEDRIDILLQENFITIHQYTTIIKNISKFTTTGLKNFTKLLTFDKQNQQSSFKSHVHRLLYGCKDFNNITNLCNKVKDFDKVIQLISTLKQKITIITIIQIDDFDKIIQLINEVKDLDRVIKLFNSDSFLYNGHIKHFQEIKNFDKFIQFMNNIEDNNIIETLIKEIHNPIKLRSIIDSEIHTTFVYVINHTDIYVIIKLINNDPQKFYQSLDLHSSTEQNIHKFIEIVLFKKKLPKKLGKFTW